MINHSIFFYDDKCPLCMAVLPDVATFFAEQKKPLLIRKITAEYSTLISAIPAVVVRNYVFDTDKELVILGSKMVDHLEKLQNERDKLLEDQVNSHYE